MLSLESDRWSELQHAYGAASDTPKLLMQLEDVPESANDKEPWFSLWSSLAHQGDVYSASFAAVPHVVRALASAPLKADFAYFQFPAWVEICRLKNTVEIPDDLSAAYFAALARLPTLVAAASEKHWDDTFLQSALSAIAVAKGQAVIAEVLQELSPEVAEEFMPWFYAR
jgi:hypothetical protein